MTVIDAWVKQKTAEGNRRAEQILDRFEKDYIGTDGYNNFGYNALMNAYARTEDGATAKVEALFERMQQLASEHNNPGLLPDKLSYSSLMLSLTHEGRRGYADKVDALLKEMEDSPDESVQPDLIAYSVALDAWSKSGEAHAAERARAIPSRMTGPVRPSTVCFNCLMNIYATEGKAEEAESVLEMMDRESRAGNPRTKPRSTDFATCINAWAKSDRLSECWERSSQLFNTMMDQCDQQILRDIDDGANHCIVVQLPAVLASPLTKIVIGVDGGTESIRACCFDGSTGRVIGKSFAVPYPTFHPRPGWAEQDPAHWYENLCEAV